MRTGLNLSLLLMILLLQTPSISAQEKESPRIWLSKSTVTLECDPGVRPYEGSCTDLDPTVSIVVGGLKEGSLPEFVVEAGSIDPSGFTALWDLKGVAEGNYELRIFQTFDGKRKIVGKENVSVRKCASCHFQVVCPSLRIQGPPRGAPIGVHFPVALVMSNPLVFGDETHEPDISWVAENATIAKGQGKEVVYLNIDAERIEYPEVKVSAKVSFGRFEQCTGYVESYITPLQKGSQPTPSIELSEKQVFKPCPRKCRIGEQAFCSDSKPEARVRIRNGFQADRVSFEVTAGEIRQYKNGTAVWHLESTTPGTYKISARIIRNNKVIKIDEKEIKVKDCHCSCPISCASFELEFDRLKASKGEFFPLRVKQLGKIHTGGFIYEPKYEWSFENGDIVGERTKSDVTLLMNGDYRDGFVEAKVHVYSGIPECLRTLSKRIPVFNNPNYSLRLSRQVLKRPMPKGFSVVEGCTPNRMSTELTVESAREVEDVSYSFRNEYGQIFANGNKATWRFDKEMRGEYKVLVDVYENGQLVTTLKKSVVLTDCPAKEGFSSQG